MTFKEIKKDVAQLSLKNCHLKNQDTSFIIRVEGNGDIGLSPLPQTET